jgi:hypothetical protein
MHDYFGYSFCKAFGLNHTGKYGEHQEKQNQEDGPRSQLVHSKCLNVPPVNHLAPNSGCDPFQKPACVSLAAS